MADTLKAGIYSTLSADAGVSALVGDKIYPDRAAETKTLPYITYQVTSEMGTHNQEDGGSLAKTEVQFNVWAESSLKRSQVKEALRNVFDGKVRVTYGSSFCASVRNSNNVDTIQEPDDGSQNFVYGVFMDFDFWHER